MVIESVATSAAPDCTRLTGPGHTPPLRAVSSPHSSTRIDRPMSPLRAMLFIAIGAFLLLLWLTPDWLEYAWLMLRTYVWLAAMVMFVWPEYEGP